MKARRIYESLLIMIIIFLFCKMILAVENNVFIQQDPFAAHNANLIQIDHPELLIGPMAGYCSENCFLKSKSNHFSRVTTTINSFGNSLPLVPVEVHYNKIKGLVIKNTYYTQLLLPNTKSS